METGGGLKKASGFLSDDSFLLMNADILTDMDILSMIRFHNEKKPLASLAVTQRKSSRHFLFDKNDRLAGWQNTKTGEEKIPLPGKDLIAKAFSGIHIISPAIFPLISHEGKFSIVDVYLDLTSSNKILGFDHSGTKLVDVGKPESVEIAEELFK